MSLKIDRHTKRNIIDSNNYPSKRTRTKEPSYLEKLQATDITELRSEFGQPGSAVYFVSRVFGQLPETEESNSLINKCLRIIPSETIDKISLKVLIKAYSHLNVSSTHLFLRCLNQGNEQLALKMLEFNMIDLFDTEEPTVGVLAMQAAITSSRPDLIRLIASENSELVNAKDDDDISPLMHACFQEDDESIRTLLALGATTQEAINNAYNIENAHLLAILVNITQKEAEDSIHKSLLDSYQNKLNLLYPSKEEEDRRIVLCHIHSEHQNEGYYCYKMAEKVLSLLRKAWPEELEVTLSEKQGLFKFLEFAAIPTRQTLPRVNELVKLYFQGLPIGFPLGFDEHAFYLVMCNGYLVICNRGDGNPLDKNLLVIAIKPLTEKELEKEITDLINFYLKNPTEEEATKHYYKDIPQRLALKGHFESPTVKLLESLDMDDQQDQNCSYANLKLAIRAIA